MLQPGETGIVEALPAADALRRRLLDIGLMPGSRVLCVGSSPCKDPKAYLIRGAVMALRTADSRQVLLKQESAAVPRSQGMSRTGCVLQDPQDLQDLQQDLPKLQFASGK